MSSYRFYMDLIFNSTYHNKLITHWVWKKEHKLNKVAKA